MCIMVVEDDPLIRLILVEELEEAGFVVREAETGDQAIVLLETIDPPLSILVTDVHMPGLRSGVDLAEYVRQRLPNVPVIFTTGQPDALNKLHPGDKHEILVRKPYAPSDIIRRIHALR